MKNGIWLKWSAAILVALMLVLAFGACSQPAPAPAPTPAPAPAPSAPIVLKAVTFLPLPFQENEPYHYFIEQVSKRSNGELTVNLMGGPEAIPGPGQPEAVRSGVVDLTMVPEPYYVSIVPEIFAQQLMDTTSQEMRQTGLYDLLNEAHRKQGLVYLGPLGNSSGFFLFTKDKMTKPADLKGYKMRGGSNYAPLMNAMGISQVTMPMGDVYTGLEQGVIDGLAIVIPEIVARKLYEHVKFSIDHAFNRGLPLMVIMNSGKFDSLPSHLQKAVVDAGTDMGAWAEQNVPIIEGDARKFLETEGGMEFVKFSAADAKYYVETADQEGRKELQKRVPALADKLWELGRKP
ncbi:MAG: TRAP transporter substrate-binding protein DctP [Chloroflexota bacterium]